MFVRGRRWYMPDCTFMNKTYWIYWILDIPGMVTVELVKITRHICVMEVFYLLKIQYFVHLKCLLLIVPLKVFSVFYLFISSLITNSLSFLVICDPNPEDSPWGRDSATFYGQLLAQIISIITLIAILYLVTSMAEPADLTTVFTTLIWCHLVCVQTMAKTHTEKALLIS